MNAMHECLQCGGEMVRVVRKLPYDSVPETEVVYVCGECERED